MSRTITVIGRRWFEKVNGNTYHSVDVYVNGDHVGREPFAYGYGSQYEQTALEILYKAGIYTKDPEAKYSRVLWRTVDDNGDKLISSGTDVARKKDL